MVYLEYTAGEGRLSCLGYDDYKKGGGPMQCEGTYCRNCGQLCIARVSLFLGLTPQEQARVMALARHEDYKRGAFAFLMGDAADRILIVRYGRIKISRFTQEGEEMVLDILNAGDVLGEQTVFSAERYQAQGLCLEDTGVCALSAAAISGLVQEHPQVGVRLLGSLGQKLRDAQRLMEILSKDSALARLSGFLLYQTERAGGKTVSLSREDIASSIHIRRETVSRKLAQLKQEGVLALSGYRHIRVLDAARLFAHSLGEEKE